MEKLWEKELFKLYEKIDTQIVELQKRQRQEQLPHTEQRYLEALKKLKVETVAEQAPSEEEEEAPGETTTFFPEQEDDHASSSKELEVSQRLVDEPHMLDISEGVKSSTLPKNYTDERRKKSIPTLDAWGHEKKSKKSHEVISSKKDAREKDPPGSIREAINQNPLGPQHWRKNGSHVNLKGGHTFSTGTRKSRKQSPQVRKRFLNTFLAFISARGGRKD